MNGIIKLRERPELLERAAAWFHQKWGIPLSAYQESMNTCLAQPGGVPQWYVILDSGGDILAGAGVIDNDFHDRPDLTPNLCAVYVEPPARGQGLARAVLDAIRRDMGTMGLDRLYLVTDHVGFYERCGWEFLTLVHDLQGEAERMYTAPTL